MSHHKRPVEPYIVPIAEQERDAYDRLRVAPKAPAEKAAATV